MSVEELRIRSYLQNFTRDSIRQLGLTKNPERLALCRDMDGWSVIHLAAKHDCLELLDCVEARVLPLAPQLIDDVNQGKGTALHLAVQHGHSRIVEKLLAMGIDSSIRNREDKTALDLAKLRKLFGIAKIISNAIRPNLVEDSVNERVDSTEHISHFEEKDNRPSQSLDYSVSHVMQTFSKDKESYDDFVLECCVSGNLESLRQLVLMGASLLVQDPQGNQPLHLACRNGHLGIIKFLIGKGVRRYARNHVGWTPMHMACFSGSFTVCKYLCEEVLLDPSFPDDKGHDSLFYSKNKRFNSWFVENEDSLKASRELDSRDFCLYCGERLSSKFNLDSKEAVPRCRGEPKLTLKAVTWNLIGRPMVESQRWVYDPSDCATSIYQGRFGRLRGCICSACNQPGLTCSCFLEFDTSGQLVRVHQSSMRMRAVLLDFLISNPWILHHPLFDRCLVTKVFEYLSMPRDREEIRN